jgi:hypothetical protein
MLDRLMPTWLRGHCRLGLSREAVSVLRLGAARKSAPCVAERPLTDIAAATPDALAAQIAAALDEAGAGGVPLYATFGDDLVRYFIVTPPGNAARIQDLRAAAAVRFQMLYGEPASAWQLVADWHATAPFLACAVPQRLNTALQLAVKMQRGYLVSVTPNFVAAWNRWRRHLAADAWLATLHERALTLGLVAGAKKPRLAAVRTLLLPEDTPPIAWLREQVARAALLDNLPAPSALHLHGPRLEAWQSRVAPNDASHDERGMAVRWCTSGKATPGPESSRSSAALQLAWGGATP